MPGKWADGGVVWFSAIEGKTVRKMIQEGIFPDAHNILTDLEKLWSAQIKPNEVRPLDIRGGFLMTFRLLTHLLQEEEYPVINQLGDILGPFSEEWKPSAVAHNDFYDDQIIYTPDSSLVLVDFEETGPGDPLYDVGNILAHLRWMAHFSTTARENRVKYRELLRSAALQRFGWRQHELDLREAFALFRLSANPFRRLQRDWISSVKAGLSLAIETLAG
jgi:hypothetical protein